MISCHWLILTCCLGSLHPTGARPLNSALEIDLDFERAVRPPPQPTEEVTASIEDLIRKRIADHQFDDVPRIAPPAPEKRRKTLDLSDQKSEKVGTFLLCPRLEGRGGGEELQEAHKIPSSSGAAALDL